MEINYKKLTFAITLGMVGASAIKTAFGAAATYVGATIAKRKLKKELEKLEAEE